MVAFGKVRFHKEGEILLLRFHLQYRGVIIAEMIVSSLPQVCVRFCRDPNLPVPDPKILWFSCPLQAVLIKNHLFLLL